MQMPSSRSFVAVIVLGLAFNIGFAILNRAGWGIDFNQFYSSGRLAGTGHLYEWEALRENRGGERHRGADWLLALVVLGRSCCGAGFRPLRRLDPAWSSAWRCSQSRRLGWG